MAERSETDLPNTPDWRRAAAAAFRKLPRGSKTQCAKDTGAGKATVSQLLNGTIHFSEFVGPISDWLGIPKPTLRMSDPDFDYMRAAMERMAAVGDLEGIASIMSQVRRLDPLK